MIDFTRVDPRLYDPITPVVEKLTSSVGVDPDRILIIGAGCRDILHAALGHTFMPRATTDTDLGIAVSDWTISDHIDRHFRRLGRNGIRYSIEDIPVDIMPFGEVEDPDGVTRPTARGEDLVVFGFRDVYERALPLLLPNGQKVRLPQPAGYAALKMRSWIDRSSYGHDKDAKDLALASFWYQESQDVRNRLYDTADGFKMLTDLDMDVDLAATRLLRLDVADQLELVNQKDLAFRWAELNFDTLAKDFTLPVTGPRSPGFTRRRALVDQFSM